MTINHRTSRSDKLDRKWYMPLYDNLIDRALSQKKEENVKACLNAANGIIDNSSIKYLISPIKGMEDDKTIGNLPGEVRDTGMINVIRERNLGEYIGLGYDFTVVVHNSDAVLRRDAKIAEEVNTILQQELINMLNKEYEEKKENGEDTPETGVPSKEVPDIEAFVKDRTENWIDDRASDGFNTLQLLNSINDFENKRIQAFFYWWACEEFYTYREVINGEVYTRVISPLDGYPITNGAQFIEDEDGFVIREYTSISELKSRVYDTLSKEEQAYLDNYKVDTVTGRHAVSVPIIVERLMDVYGTPSTYGSDAQPFNISSSDEQIPEYTLVFRTQVPYTIRYYLDIFGNELSEIVDPTYTKQENDTKLETIWIEEVWVGKRYGDKLTGVYAEPKPVDAQRYDRHKVRPKLPVGGKKGILTGIAQNPIPKRLIEYTLIDRILNLQIERTLAKYKNAIMVMPQSMINPDSTGTTDQKMFYIKADDTLIYDDTTVDFNTVAQGFRVVGFPPLGEYLRTLIDLREKYKQEALEMANMNSYRLGDVQASTGKGVMQESIARAAVGNVLQITMFNAALERDHMADLEFSKVAYSEGKEGSYVDTQTGRVIPVTVDPIKHIESDYGIFVRNAKVDEDTLNQYRQFAMSAVPAGEFELASAAIESKNVPSIRKAIKEIIKANKELQATMEANRNNAVVQAETIKSQTVDKEIQKDVTIANIKAEADVTSSAIRAANGGESGNINPDLDSTISGLVDSSRKERELATKEIIAQATIRQKDEQLRLKDKEITSKERIAAMNRNKYDVKNKSNK